jgi:hypothetical protein
MPRVFRHSLGLLPLLLLWTFLGCSSGNPPTYKVKGKVAFPDDTPVTWGRVECQSEKGGHNAAGKIKADGTFELSTFRDGDGAIAGHHRVIVVQFASAGLSDPRAPHSKTHTEPPRLVNRRHSAYESSELSLDVNAAGENTPKITVSAQ